MRWSIALALAAPLAMALLGGCLGGDEDAGSREPGCEADAADCPSGPPPAPGSPPPAPGSPPASPGQPPAGPPGEPSAPAGPPRTWPEPGAASIRPGAALDGGSCTANFVFTSLDNRTVYLGTAAHCFSQDLNTQTNGCRARLRELGTAMQVAGGGRARLVYSSWHAMQADNETENGLCTGNDFALLELTPEDANATSPALERWGGPTGMASGASTGAKVLSYGNSGTRPQDSPLSPREGYVSLGGTRCETRVVFPNTPIPGDSGSPVILADGRALGAFVSLELTPIPGQGHVCLLEELLEYAAESGFPVRLATWELLDNGLP